MQDNKVFKEWLDQWARRETQVPKVSQDQQVLKDRKVQLVPQVLKVTMVQLVHKARKVMWARQDQSA